MIFPLFNSVFLLYLSGLNMMEGILYLSGLNMMEGILYLSGLNMMEGILYLSGLNMKEGILNKEQLAKVPSKPKEAKLKIMGGDFIWILPTRS